MGLLGDVLSNITKIVIKFDPEPGRPFLAGETMAGKVILSTEKDDVKIQKLTMKLLGKVQVNWKDVSFKMQRPIIVFLPLLSD